MRQIHDPLALAALLQKQLRPGLRANGALDAARYISDLVAGTLYVEDFDGGLYLFRKRDGFARMSYFALPDAPLPAPVWPEPIYMETAHRSNRKADTEWPSLGFEQLFTRTRLTRQRGAPLLPAPMPVRFAEETDLPLLREILLANYNPMTGCIPTDAELCSDLRARRLLLLDHCGAMLHFIPCSGGTETRHIAVASSKRRRGAAQSLLSFYLSAHSEGVCRVWIGDSNLPSMNFFEKNGYRPDGWVSEIWKTR